MDTLNRFRYEVRPFMPIKDLIPGQSLSRPFSSELTKEEVLKCMKYGPVYRLFPGKDPIKVTGSNIDDLHKSSPESEKTEDPSNHTENVKNDVIETTTPPQDTKTDAPTEEKVVENTTEPEKEPVKEEVKETVETVEEKPVEEKKEEVVEEKPAEEVKEETTESTEEKKEETAPVEDKKDNGMNAVVSMNQNVNRKKRHHPQNN